MTVGEPSTNDRVIGALAAMVANALIGWVLIMGLATQWTRAPRESLSVFGILPPPMPPPQEIRPPRPSRNQRAERAPSPPNLRSEATALVAPPPLVIPPIPPPPIVAAETPDTGFSATTGAAPIAGPGTGAGGAGDGNGGGNRGDGNGGDETPPRRIKGALKDSDYPSSAGESGFQGIVSVRFLVDVTGRVAECEVTRSSGSVDLDATTCRLIAKRYRYDPSRDARGRPVPAIIVENHSWVIENEPPAPARS